MPIAILRAGEASVAEVATGLRIAPEEVRKLIKNGSLRSRRLANQVRIKRGDVRTMLEVAGMRERIALGTMC